MAKFKLHPSVTESRVYDLVEARMHTLDDPGICTRCGAEQDGVEPDAQRYECDACGERGVYGTEELLMRGWYYRNLPEAE